MLKKIEQYYVRTFKKFGWKIPAIAVGGAFAVAIVFEATSCLGKLPKAVAPLFWVLFAIGCAAVVAGVVFTALNLKKEEVNVIDVCLACVAALALLMMIMYLFSLGAGQMLLKWIVTPVVLVGSLVLTYFRVQNVK